MAGLPVANGVWGKALVCARRRGYTRRGTIRRILRPKRHQITMKTWKFRPNTYDVNLVKGHDVNSAINTSALQKPSLGASLHALKILGSGASPSLRRPLDAPNPVEQSGGITTKAASNYDESVERGKPWSRRHPEC